MKHDYERNLRSVQEHREDVKDQKFIRRAIAVIFIVCALCLIFIPTMGKN